MLGYHFSLQILYLKLNTSNKNSYSSFSEYRDIKSNKLVFEYKTRLMYIKKNNSVPHIKIKNVNMFSLYDTIVDIDNM